MNRSRGGMGSRARGVAMIQAVVVTGVVGLGVAALAIDSGLMFHSRQELQNAADASALAAAMELGSIPVDSGQMARDQAALYASKNNVALQGMRIDSNQDVTFGHATFSSQTGKYTFTAGAQPFDAVQVVAHRDSSNVGGPIDLLFGRALGQNTADISASAVAMLVPRDIAVVIDLSGSMNDDSELRHSATFLSESGSGTRAGVQVNLKDIWTALPKNKGINGVGSGSTGAPTVPSGGNSQPGSGSGTPQAQGGNPDSGTEPSGGSGNPAGPRWGWMTGWGSALTLGSYSAAGDGGLYYLARSKAFNDPDAHANLSELGYTNAERNALESFSNDATWQFYLNRVKVCLGLAAWRSGKSGAKFSGGGNGDDRVDTAELIYACPWPFSAGSWDAYISYVSSSSSMMYQTDNSVRYRFGIKTFVNYLLEQDCANNQVPELAATPEMPLASVKGAVQVLSDTVTALQSQDMLSLEIFATTLHHEVDLTSTFQSVPNRLNAMQSGHYDTCTNIAGGLSQAIAELTSSRARPQARKIIILMTDGKPNVDQNGNYVGDNDPAALSWTYDRATYAANNGMVIYTIAVGGDADQNVTQQIAQIGKGQAYFAGSTPDLYAPQLQQIFQALGGRRAVQLIR